MRCKYCNYENSPGASFCGSCGKPLNQEMPPNFHAPPKKSHKIWLIIGILVILAVGALLAFFVISNFLSSNTHTEDQVLQSQIDNEAEEKSLIDDKETKETVPETEGIKHQLPVKRVIQEEGYDTGPACLKMVLDLHGHTISQEQLASEICDSYNTNSEKLTRTVNKYRFGYEVPGSNRVGYRLENLSNWNDEQMLEFEERIKTDTESNDPVFIYVDTSLLYESSSFTSTHFVLVTGYISDDNGNILGYCITDPSDDIQSEAEEGLLTIAKEDFYSAISKTDKCCYIW